MKQKNIIITVAFVAILVISFFLATQNFFLSPTLSASSEFYVGIQCGYDNVTLCKALIDKVKDYTNLFIIGSTDIVTNVTELNEVCDYAYNVGLHFSVYFSPAQTYTELGENITTSTTLPNGTVAQSSYPSRLPIAWINNSVTKYGDHFLGAYFFDEPGGKQLDNGVSRMVNSERDYLSTANAYVRNISANLQPYLNSTAMTFTADYGLYWFDYKAGYDTVLADFGFNNSRQLQVSLCRGAANVQNKDWGIMITHKFSDVQLLESGPELYDELVLGFNSGAKYAVVFNYAETGNYPQVIYQPYEYGILQDEHFDALQSFWSYIHNNPEKHGSLKGDVVLVLPEIYGLGFRNSNDKVWGLFKGDGWSQMVISDVNNYIAEYGSRLDIVYKDPQYSEVVQNSYAQIIDWESNIASGNFSVKNLNTNYGYATIQAAINSGATSDGDVIDVKSGVYSENLIINKTLTIVGEDKATTIIDGGNRGTGIEITINNVTLSGFTIRNSGTNTSAGIYLNNVNNCNIHDNIVTANNDGIYLNCSSGNMLKNNVMSGNVHNFGVDGEELSHFINSIDSSNTVNGRKVYYMISESNLNINPSAYPNAGYLAIVNSTGINVQDLSLSNNGNGILLVNTQSSTVTGNEVANSTTGIQLINSEGNTLRNNQLSNNVYNLAIEGDLSNDFDASNTLNGKIIYYWINEHDKTVPSNAGYVALVNCSGITIQNLNLTNNWKSIFLSSTSNSTITQNQISDSYYGIVLEGSSKNNRIHKNNVTDNTQGIVMSNSQNNNITNNILSNNQYGAYLISSNFNNISGNTVQLNTHYGMQFTSSCNNNTLIGNSMMNNKVAIEFTDSLCNAIIQNNLTGNSQSLQIHGESTQTLIAENYIANSICGVEIANSNALTPQVHQNQIFYYIENYGFESGSSSLHNISQNILTNNTYGILITASNNASIVDNTITGSETGIYLSSSFGYLDSIQNCTVKQNIVTNSSNIGLNLVSVDNCSIIENSIINSLGGISLSNSKSNLLKSNNVSNTTQIGIQIGSSSSGNIFRDNTMVGNSYGFNDDSIQYSTRSEVINGILKNKPEYSTNDVDASNTVNGKPIIYWIGQSDKTVPSNAACVILVNCTNITVQNLNLTNNYYGVQLAYTNNSTIIDNNLQDNFRAINLQCSSYNTIKANNVTSNTNGISLEQELLTIGYDQTANKQITMTIPSTGNIFTENNIKSNINSITIGNSNYYSSSSSNDVSGNTFWQNNFINNTNQLSLPQHQPNESPIPKNNWDNGAKGNYWSDYNGTDANVDGIGDSVYQIITQRNSNTGALVNFVIVDDKFPLIHPFSGNT